MISLNDVLLAMSNIPVDDPIAEIWGRGLQGWYKIIEYTGTLPITINANGDALLDYRIYGADGGVGVATENLIDADKPGIQRVELEPNTDYCLCKYTGRGPGGWPSCYVYDENDNQLFGDYINVWFSYSFTNPSNGAYARISFNSAAKGKLSFAKGRADSNFSLYPANYIPYGYKLPMIVNNGITNIVPPAPAETKTLNGITVTSDGKGTYTISGTATADATLEFDFGTSISCGSKHTFAIFNDFVSIPTSMSFVGQAAAFSISQLNRVIYDSSNLVNRTLTGVRISIPSAETINGTISPMIFDGVNITPTEFVPYVPSVSYDVPVYIGENQLDAIGEYKDYVDFGIQKIARKIRGYTFTGNETFNLFAQNAYGTCWVNLRLYTTVAYCPIHQTTLRSSHFTAINNSDADFWYGYPQLDDACNFEKEDGYDTVKIFFRSTANFSTAEECKAYFKEQYDNGTPVKIWFVMKYTVGQYESTDNGKEDPPVPLPEIPTIDGTTIIDYDGTPKPSQMYVKYKDKSGGA